MGSVYVLDIVYRVCRKVDIVYRVCCKVDIVYRVHEALYKEYAVDMVMIDRSENKLIFLANISSYLMVCQC